MNYDSDIDSAIRDSTQGRSFRQLPLEELPQWSRWPARLLGLELFETVSRNVEKIEEEYNRDKYATTCRLYEQSGSSLNPIDLRLHAVTDNPKSEICAIVDGRLVIGTVADLLEHELELFCDWLFPAIEGVDAVIELGAGIGTNLWALAQRYPDKRFIGADWSENAVHLAGALYGSEASDIRLERFDFYADGYPILDEFRGRAIVLTSQAIEQLPTAAHVINTLCRYADKIDTVIHLEPSYELLTNNLLDLMRKRYIELNDYNRDLLSVLNAHWGVDQLEVRSNVFAFNPFNVLALYQWSPRVEKQGV